MDKMIRHSSFPMTMLFSVLLFAGTLVQLYGNPNTAEPADIRVRVFIIDSKVNYSMHNQFHGLAEIKTALKSMRNSDPDASVKIFLDPEISFVTWMSTLQIIHSIGYKSARSFIELEPGKRTGLREITLGAVKEEAGKWHRVAPAK